MGCCEGKDLKINFVDKEVDLTKIDDVLNEYKDVDGSLISILQHTQEEYGFLPLSALEYIAHGTGINSAKIYGVATFYTQFRLDPIGDNLIMLCQGTACHVNSSLAIEEAINEELGIIEGETTEDDLFTLNNVACLGCCSLSPVMMINDETYGYLTPEKTKTILRDIKKKCLEAREEQ